MQHFMALMTGTVVGDVLYGIYFTLFLTSTGLTCRRVTGNKSGSIYRSAAFISSLILFATVTSTCILDTVRIVQGFLLFEAGPVAFFADDSQPTAVAVNICTLASGFINDFIMIYRLYIVWGREKLIIVLPVLAAFGFTGCAAVLIFDIKKLENIAPIVSLTGLILTLATNIYCTVAISWKIYTITKACMPTGGTNLRDLIAMFVESSALYTSWALFYGITHQINDTSQLFAVATLPPIAGIANALLQARIGMGTSVEYTTPPSQPLHFRTRTATGQVTLDDDLEFEGSLV
ncbi:hypothetical protein C8F04DRAFT_1134955 [Mycena alexandri]|uniref:Uncharacterized protein n=1 Tax=Mycena alexandri TaxID=1745969 RepID=A0AAD6S907_9AGAR|nr:hypothetical protein C8F04DRAFT_1145503 [Mycena alexandri]KAJ7023278.1 hypothetical protein C8F04DRAFT_1134955 [Mycena alexandri]